MSNIDNYRLSDTHPPPPHCPCFSVAVRLLWKKGCFISPSFMLLPSMEPRSWQSAGEVFSPSSPKRACIKRGARSVGVGGATTTAAVGPYSSLPSSLPPPCITFWDTGWSPRRLEPPAAGAPRRLHLSYCSQTTFAVWCHARLPLHCPSSLLWVLVVPFFEPLSTHRLNSF